MAAAVGLDFQVEPHHCFGCGTLNPHGLRMPLHIIAGRAWSELTLDERFEGWQGIAHGGILATILDEIMGWALADSDEWGVTARLQVDYRRPVPVGVALRADGWIERSRRRLIDTAGRIADPATGLEYATATGLYAVVDEARKRELRERYGFRRGSAGPTENGHLDPREPVAR